MLKFGLGLKRVAVKTSNTVGTIIGQGTQISGVLQSTGVLRLDGTIEGDFINSQELIIGSTGIAKANIIAQTATIGGTVYGNIEVAEKLEILQTARIYGDIKAGGLNISEGAVFKGICEVFQKDKTEPDITPA